MKKLTLLSAILSLTMTAAHAGFDDIKKPFAKKNVATTATKTPPLKSVAKPINPPPKPQVVAKPAPVTITKVDVKPTPAATPKVEVKPEPVIVAKPKTKLKKVAVKKAEKPAPTVAEVKPIPAPVPPPVKEKPLFNQAKDNVKEASHKGLDGIGSFLGKVSNDIKKNGVKESTCTQSQRAMSQC